MTRMLFYLFTGYYGDIGRYFIHLSGHFGCGNYDIAEISTFFVLLVIRRPHMRAEKKPNHYDDIGKAKF